MYISLCYYSQLQQTMITLLCSSLSTGQTMLYSSVIKTYYIKNLKHVVIFEQVTEREAAEIQEKTRDQSSSKSWFNERSWRIISSRFGYICFATQRRNKTKLCQSLVQTSAVSFRNEAISHGKFYESKTISSFEAYTGPKVKRCGLFVCVQRPYLGASPDGLVLNESVIEVKCPYTGRHERIVPGKHFSFLKCKWGDCFET